VDGKQLIVLVVLPQYSVHDWLPTGQQEGHVVVLELHLGFVQIMVFWGDPPSHMTVNQLLSISQLSTVLQVPPLQQSNARWTDGSSSQ